MEEEKSNEMDVSYGVNNPEDSIESANKSKSKKSKSKKKAGKSKVIESSKGVTKEDKEAKPPKKDLIKEINDMKASGDVNSSEFTDKMAELENILGVDTINPFGTNEIEVFERNLKGMNMADMKNLAAKVGINPFHEKSVLKNILKKEFMAANRNNMKNIMPSPQNSIQLDPNNPQHAKTIAILGDI